VRLVDHSRARTLLTYVRYPALGVGSGTDLASAPAASAGGPYPLIVFAHGFDLVPDTYTQLLRSWARAGYVVAAPVLPLTNANAPGGPTQTDLPNQPQDLRVVISRLLAFSAAAGGPFAGLIDPRRIAVGGHSDGGDTVLAVAYGRRTRDPRVRAAVVLSGAELQGFDTLAFPRGSPPLLAAQGTADTINSPASTSGFYDVVQRPKYLLSLLGATHVPPYSNEQPQLAIVERVTVAFLDEYVNGDRSASRRLLSAARVPGLSTLTAEP
jgi:predicted dienelactone hydrolase